MAPLPLAASSHCVVLLVPDCAGVGWRQLVRDLAAVRRTCRQANQSTAWAIEGSLQSSPPAAQHPLVSLTTLLFAAEGEQDDRDRLVYWDAVQSAEEKLLSLELPLPGRRRPGMMIATGATEFPSTI